jgi:hypothetical protein
MRLNFSSDDDTGIYGVGWGSVEVESEEVSKRWATASQAELFLTLPVDKNLVFSFKGFRAPGLDQQEITLKINDEVIATRVLGGSLQEIYMPVPASSISSQETRILLEFSDLKEPENNEKRDLAVAFFSLVIYQR